VSRMSLGSWITWGVSISDEEAYRTMRAAFECGCNFFDTAELYGRGKAEIVMGKCLKRLASELNVRRSQLVIATKVYFGVHDTPNEKGLSRKHIVEGVIGSLARLELAYVDVVFAHRPDPDTPMDEIVRGFNALIEQGRAFYWGTSEWTALQIAEAVAVAERLGLVAPVVEQPQYSLLHRTRLEVEYLPLFTQFQYGTTIWSPLASGLLTGKYTKEMLTTTNRQQWAEGKGESRLVDAAKDGAPYKFLHDSLLDSSRGLMQMQEKDLDVIFDKIAKLQKVAQKIGCSLPQLAIAWCLVNKNVTTVITGASRVEQVYENFRSLNFVDAVRKELPQIEVILAGK